MELNGWASPRMLRRYGASAINGRFGCRYTDAELAGWAPKVRAMARDAGHTQVLFNHCYRDYAQINAQQPAALLQPRPHRAPAPPK